MSGRRWLAWSLALATVVWAGGCGESDRAQTHSAATVPWCTAPPDDAWTAALASPVVELSRTASLLPWAMGGDGSTFFASMYAPEFSGVVRVDARTGAYRPILRFAHPDRYQASGAFDGRWLVMREYHRLQDSLADNAIWAWDGVTGRLTRIGQARPDGSGGFIPSPWRDVSVRDGFATWTAGTAPDGSGEVHVYDLANARDRVVRRGHPGGSLLLDGAVVAWPESTAPDAPAQMRASTTQGASASVPAALEGTGMVDAVATDGSAIAIPAREWRTLEWSPDLTTRRTTVVRTASDDVVANNVVIDGSLVGYGIEPVAYLADASVGRAVSLPNVAFTLMDANAIVLVGRSGETSLHPKLAVRLLARQALPPMPACTG